MGDCLRTTGAAGMVLDLLYKKSQIKKFYLHDSWQLTFSTFLDRAFLYLSSHKIVRLGFFPNSYAAEVCFKLTSIELGW